MRHRRDHKQLSRTAEHRRALLRNLVTALFEHERIETTATKAKEARRVAERLITVAKRNDLAGRRQVGSYVFSETVTKKLFDTIAPWYTERPGGYTRIVRMPKRRLGDAAEMVILELVKSSEQKAEDRRKREEAATTKAERRRAREGAQEPAAAQEEAKAAT